jgi:AraC-like DNA-binding protein
MSDVSGSTPFRYLSEPRWYLWHGGFLLIARAEGEVPAHAHHAIQIVFGLDGSPAIRGEVGVWHSGQGLIVRADAVHSFNASGRLGAMIFVDPESHEGIWLQAALAEDITVVPETRLVSPNAELRTFVERPFEGMDVQPLVRLCVRALSPGAPPMRRIDERVTGLLERITASADLRISLGDAADIACLSPSRFAHLFRQQLGLPFSRYMLWRKVTRAMLVIGSERTLAAAAHAADFADAAHLTRTFRQMFGIPPSALMRGEFAEIDSPFDDAVRQAR